MKSHAALIGALFFTLVLIVSSFTVTSIASPYIVWDLGGDRTITTYGLSFFGFGTAITIPLARPLAARFGVSKIVFYSILTFAFANLLSAVAPTYFLFICTRFLAGMATGPFYPLLAHSFPALTPVDKKIAITWIFITILVVFPVVGACWGGCLAYLYTWRSIFFLNAPLAALMAWVLRSLYKEASIPEMEGGFDWVGWVFYAGGIFCLTFTIATAQQLDWYRSNLLVSLFLVGLVLLGYYVIRSTTHERPVLDLSFFKKPLFSLTILCLALLFSTYFGIILLLSIWLRLDVQFTPLWIALLIGHMGIAGLFPRFIVEEKLGRIDPRFFIAAASLILSAACFYTTIFNIEINFGRIAFSRVLTGFGLALFLPPIFQILSQSFEPKRWVDVFEVFQVVRNLAGGIGASIFSIVWQRRTSFFHERLGEGLQREVYPTERFLNKFEALKLEGAPLAELNDLLNKRASSLALDDVFYLMGFILAALFVLIALTFFVKKDAFNLAKVKYSDAP